MRREVLLTVAVLLPFAVLVAIGFLFLRAPLPQPSHDQAPALVVPPPATAAPAPPALDAGSPPADAPPSQDPSVAAVEPAVRQCFTDAQDRIREPQEVVVRFETTASGFARVVISRSTWPDPEVAACVQDAFEEAHLSPSGEIGRSRTHTFTFYPADAGR